MEAIVSGNGNAKDDAQRYAKEQPERADPAERKISDLLGVDKQAEETSREDPNTPPEGANASDQAPPG
jgi:hypothetical protein